MDAVPLLQAETSRQICDPVRKRPEPATTLCLCGARQDRVTRIRQGRTGLEGQGRTGKQHSMLGAGEGLGDQRTVKNEGNKRAESRQG